jgi:hypothetical protein
MHPLVMKHFVFFLAVILLIPFGAKPHETLEKSEAERIECFSHVHRHFNNNKQKICKEADKVLVDNRTKILSTSHSYSKAKFTRKIYLLQRQLLI